MKERLNWREACEVLGCSKSTLYRLVANGQLRAFGVGSRGRWYSRTECERFVLDRGVGQSFLLPKPGQEAKKKKGGRCC